MPLPQIPSGQRQQAGPHTATGWLGPRPGATEWLRIIAWSLALFASLGTLTALWENPWFIRMTPIVSLDFVILAFEALLLGLYLGLNSTACGVKRASLGGIFAFLGFGCSICNKILVLLFGSTFLLNYFEPVRHWVGLAGLLVLGWVLHNKLALRRGAQTTG